MGGRQATLPEGKRAETGSVAIDEMDGSMLEEVDVIVAGPWEGQLTGSKNLGSRRLWAVTPFEIARTTAMKL